MDLGLAGKVAIVTGATQGIGRATAFRLAQEGASVALCGRDAGRLEQTLAELRAAGARAIGVQADVAAAADCERLVAETVAAFGGVDILVNNAGTAQVGAFESVTDETWQADLDLKLFAAIRLCRRVIPSMRARGGGRIVNVTNIGAKQPSAKSMPTTVSRAAGQAMTKALSRELAPDGILVNTVCIGLVRAGQHEARARARGVETEALYAEMGRGVPLGRVGEADEAADVIAFLVSARASFVTGSSVNIDGGASAVF
ncbi:MAG: SDR family oxidoreductase [Burkholderiales bacterium]|jgi:NAD(P)-dependent dehydrogenase (short-subunit alcohol dehydrogenase family)